MPYNATLKTLQDSIMRGDLSVAKPFVRPKQRMTVEEQIAIYSNAYRIRLRQAVLSDYPCLASHLGETINAWINAYVKATPSHSYNLDFYPHGFWRFVKAKTTDRAIGELAELEGAIAEVFMGTGSAPLTPEHLPPMDEESLGQMPFQLRQPCRLLHFAHDVENAMAAFKRGEPISPPPAQPIYMLIYRHANEAQRRILEEGEYHLLAAIAATKNFNDALQRMIGVTGYDETAVAGKLEHWLPRWIQLGFLAQS